MPTHGNCGSDDPAGSVEAARLRLFGLPEGKLDEMCRRHNVWVLTLFGSAADPEVDRPRDLDFGVVFEPGSRHDVVGLLDSLVSLLGTEAIDVVDAAHATTTARRRAIADGIALYEREPMEHAFAAMAADGTFMETASMRRDTLRSLLATTTAPLDVATLRARLSTIGELLDDLRRHGNVQSSDLEVDRDLRHSLERVLASLVDTAGQINADMLAAAGRRAPTDNRDGIELLAHAGILPGDLANRLATCVERRDLLTHQPERIYPKAIADAVPETRTTFSDYRQVVEDHLAHNSEPQRH
ncbi:HepT-like ribonuclease domain-containing protein [Salsipaludibacter albus]|uniref:HepT-like ribonuclease domain-containing protein n=1 Tax=Salsipaludibacter albus TaxID=2849650 RepID=UPI001EE4B827|nr:HepT-like ribonuclease domain-containing protein [Salsipaludibacter albus]MBY5163143.1 DUF86 domain-containing protein [Salsipaludibacter albus]